MTQKPIEILDLDVRTFNSLKRAGIYTLEAVYELLASYSRAEITNMIRHFGDQSYDALRDALASYENQKSIHGHKPAQFEVRYYHCDNDNYENEDHSSVLVSFDSFYQILHLIESFVPVILDIDFDIYDNQTYVLRTSIYS